MLKNLNYNKIKIEKNREYKLGLVFTLLPVAIFALILCNKTMPLAEGWYTYYAQLINEGQVVYKDFEYLFMPGYITFIALFTKIFGYSIIALRILGVVFFVLITYFAYRIFNELFNPISACMGALTTAFYLQSEVVQIFYDYIRMMDIFAYITVFLLIKISKSIAQNKKPDFRITIAAGFANAMVLMIKQNIGLILGFFVFIYFVFLFVYKSDKKNIFFNLIMYGVGAAIVFAGYGSYLLINGALGDCLSQTLFGAAEAKGGVKSILFSWLVEGKNSFLNELNVVLIVSLVILLLLCLKKIFPSSYEKEKKQRKIVFYVFGVCASLGIIALYLSESFAESFTDVYQSKTYGFYLFATLVFFAMMLLYAIDIFRKNKKYNNYIGFFLLFGAIFAIGYGVGMSGGLVSSQIALSTGLIICIFASLCSSKYSWISLSLVAVASMCFVMFCSSFKMVTTYSWWGLTSSSIWECTETIDNVEIFKGLKVSEEEKEMYEGIINDIEENTQDGDSIFVFPHASVLYTASDREDPNTFTKVQWYDVSTNDSVEADLEVVENASPKVIIIYNIPDYAVEAHEESFNKGKESATTVMMTELREYCIENNYSAVNHYQINSNSSVTVYVKSETSLNWNDGGSGTKSDPYTISTTEQFLNFADLVNGGATFEGLYVKLTADIDLSECTDFTPIGNEVNATAFNGVFDGGGHEIKNLTVDKSRPKKAKKKSGSNKPYNFALFGEMNGKIYNLGINNFNIKGYCVAGLVRYSASQKANISNCYIKNSTIIGESRSGAIADHYCGYIYNSVALDTQLDADKSVGFVSLRNAGFRLENCYTNIKYYHDTSSEYITDEEANSEAFVDELNANVNAFTKRLTTSKKKAYVLSKWTLTNGTVKFSK